MTAVETIPGQPVPEAERPSAISAWTIFVRDAALERVGELDDYKSLKLIPRFNEIGSFEVEVARDNSLADALLERGAGIIAVKGDRTVLSGRVRRRLRKKGADLDSLVLTGSDDLRALANRVAKPQPATSVPPYNSDAYDDRTGVCSTILRQYVAANAISGTATTDRVVAGLVNGTDPVAGSTVTGSGRWQPLLELLQELALAGGVGFRLTQQDAALTFDVYAPEDLTDSIRLSEDLGTLSDVSYSDEAPEGNYCYVLGSGEGTARTVREVADGASMTQWSERVEFTRDRRDTTDATQMDQSAAEELATRASKVSLDIVPVELAQMAFLADYDLGDEVLAVVDGVQVPEVIREAEITFGDDGVRVVPKIGTPKSGQVLALFDEVAELRKRIRDLERR